MKGKIRVYCRVRPLSKSELDRVRTNVTSVLSRQTAQQVRARSCTYKCHVSIVASDRSASPSSIAYVQMSRQYCRVRPLSKSELDRVRTNVTSVLSRQTAQQVRARPRTYKCHISTVASDLSASPSSTAYVQMSRQYCRVRPLSKSELDRVRTNVTSVLSRQTAQQVRARPRTYKCHVSTVASDRSASPSSIAYVQMSRQYCRVRPLSKSELNRVRTNVTSVLSCQTSRQVRARPRTYKCHVSTVASDRSASPSSTAYVQMSRQYCRVRPLSKSELDRVRTNVTSVLSRQTAQQVRAQSRTYKCHVSTVVSDHSASPSSIAYVQMSRQYCRVRPLSKSELDRVRTNVTSVLSRQTSQQVRARPRTYKCHVSTVASDRSASPSSIAYVQMSRQYCRVRPLSKSELDRVRTNVTSVLSRQTAQQVRAQSRTYKCHVSTVVSDRSASPSSIAYVQMSRQYCRVRPLGKSELDRVRTNVTSVLSRQTSQQVRARPRTYKCHISTVASDHSASPSSTAYVQMSRQYCRVRPLSKSELDRVRTNVTSVLSCQTAQQVRARPRTYKCHVSTVASDRSASPSSIAYVQMSRQYCRVRPLSKSELDRVRTNVTLLVTYIICHNIITALFKLQDVCDRWLPPSGFL